MVLFASFGAFLIALVLVEGVLRLFFPQNVEPHPKGLYTEDSKLGFVLTAGHSGLSRKPEWTVPISINADGLRDREIGKKRDGELRILVLGDSFTFGAGVTVQEAYSRQIEERLRKDWNLRVTVVNAGVPGYGTEQAAAFFERVVERVQPDTVLLGFFIGNDFYDNLHLNQYKMVQGSCFLVGKAGCSAGS